MSEQFVVGPPGLPTERATFSGPTNKLPYYFVDGNFVGYEGPSRFQGSREYHSLPGLRRVIVDRWNYLDLARKTWIPISCLAAHTAGIKYQDQLPPVSEWQFLDIETDIKGFTLGVLNDRVFTRPKDLVDEVLANRDQGQKVVCSFNGFRFDNRILGQLDLLPSIRFGSYTIHYFPGMLNVDLWYWARNHFPDAESKSLRDLAQLEGYPVEWSKLEKYNEIRASEDNKMARFLADKINVREAWKLMITLTNCCPLILQNAFLDRTHKAILHSWYLEHGYLPIEYPNPGDSDIVTGPIREAVPGLYEDASMVDVKSAYLTRATSRQLRLYDEEDPPAFTSVMQKFLDLIRQYPKQKPMLKFLAVSLVGSQHSDNNFLRRQSIYTDVVQGFAEEFASYLSKLPVSPFYIHTDGYLTLTDVQPSSFAGYELTVKNQYRWIVVYDMQKSLGLLEGEPRTIKSRGFPIYSNNFPTVLRWVRDRFHEELARVSGVSQVRRILGDPRSFLGVRVRLPRARHFWESTVWKESEMFPERWDPRSPLWNDWSDLKLGPNKYRWPRQWVLEKIDDLLEQHRLPRELASPIISTSARRD